jgi:hypothetical protein
MDILSRVLGNDVSVWGRNAIAGTGWEELYAYDQALAWETILAAAAKVDITSSSAADAAAGTGARTLRLVGLDANYRLQWEDIALNGQTIVVSLLSYLRLFGAEVLTVGTGGSNAGDIHIVKTGTGGSYTAGVPGTLTSALCKMLIGVNSAMSGIFTAPAGESYQAMSLAVGVRTQAAIIALAFYPVGGPLITPYQFELAAGAAAVLDLEKFRITLKEKQDLRMRVQGAAASAIAQATLQLRKT